MGEGGDGGGSLDGKELRGLGAWEMEGVVTWPARVEPTRERESMEGACNHSMELWCGYVGVLRALRDGDG